MSHAGGILIKRRPQDAELYGFPKAFLQVSEKDGERVLYQRNPTPEVGTYSTRAKPGRSVSHKCWQNERGTEVL